MSTIEQDPLADCIYEDMNSLLDGLIPITECASREGTLEIAKKLLQGESIRFDEKILALFPCKA